MWPNKQLKLHMKNNQPIKRWQKKNTIECEFLSIDIIQRWCAWRNIKITRGIGHEEDEDEEAKRVKHIFSLWIANNPSLKSRSEIFFWTKFLACLLAWWIDGLIAWLLLQELYELADPVRDPITACPRREDRKESGSESCWWGKKGSGIWFESLGWCTYLSLLTHSLPRFTWVTKYHQHHHHYYIIIKHSYLRFFY
jgi:hypothetical protein